MPSIYRGIVLDNKGDSGKCKIYIPGVYPPEYINSPTALPWAEPAMALFGGNYITTNKLNNNTGICGWAKIGSYVWVFFESDDQNVPIYFAFCQGGKDWFSEHVDQYVFQSDNVKIRIDDNPSIETSSSKFDSYNKTNVGEAPKVSSIPTTLDIEVLGNVNLRVTGNVNLLINGNMYTEINGERHETVNGNIFRKHVGNLIEEHTGNKLIRVVGNEDLTLTGSRTQTITNNNTVTINNNETVTVNNVSTHTNNNQLIEKFKMKTTTVLANEIISVAGTRLETILGGETRTINNSKIVNVVGNDVNNVNGSKIVKARTIVNSGRAVLDSKVPYKDYA